MPGDACPVPGPEYVDRNLRPRGHPGPEAQRLSYPGWKKFTGRGASRHDCRRSAQGTTWASGQAHPRETTFAHLVNMRAAGRDFEAAVLDALPVDPDRALLDHAQGV